MLDFVYIESLFKWHIKWHCVSNDWICPWKDEKQLKTEKILCAQCFQKPSTRRVIKTNFDWEKGQRGLMFNFISDYAVKQGLLLNTTQVGPMILLCLTLEIVTENELLFLVTNNYSQSIILLYLYWAPVVQGSYFTNHSQEHSLSFSPRFCQFECNTTYDWQNFMV